MFRPVELPLWLFLLILVFALVTFASHFLFPSVRWYLRRRLERAVQRLNERLKVPIQPFKLARRTDTIRRLLFDPAVAQAVLDHAAATGMREDVAHQTAERYAREIVPGFSAFAYFGFAIRAARLLSQSLFRVRLAAGNEEALERIDPNATIVFVMNHRSNMDYVLVTWLVAERSALAYAVGEWARVWPLRQLVRALGGFFIRRRHNNALYRKVLARYVQLATEGGVTQAVFPEGGLSLTGALGAPKLGLLSYILDGFRPGRSREIVFVPVALNYDRVMEDRILIRAHRDGTRRFRFSLRPIFRQVRRQLWLRATGRFHRFGYAGVGFGEPLVLSDFLAGTEGDAAAALGKELMARIAAVMPVTPVPLVAFGLSHGLTDRSRLRAFVERTVEAARDNGATILIPRGDIDYTLEAGLRALAERKLLSERDGMFTLDEEGALIVDFYARSVAHLLPPPEMAAT